MVGFLCSLPELFGIVIVKWSPGYVIVCLWTLTHNTPGAPPLVSTSTNGLSPSHFTVNSHSPKVNWKRIKNHEQIKFWIDWESNNNFVINVLLKVPKGEINLQNNFHWKKDYWLVSCCTVRIYQGCPLCPRAYTQPPQPHWGSSSDPAPVSVLLPTHLYILSRP